MDIDELSANEGDRVAAVKQSFLQIGKDLIAKETAPLKDWANRTMSQDAHIALQAIDRASTALLTHVMNALHPYGMDEAVQIATAAAAREADALAQANAAHQESLAQEAAQVAGTVVSAVDPAAAPVVAVAEAVVDPLLAGAASTGSAEPESAPTGAVSKNSASPAPEVSGSSTGESPSDGTPTSNGPSGESELPLEGGSSPTPAVKEPASPPSDGQPQG